MVDGHLDSCVKVFEEYLAADGNQHHATEYLSALCH
jgi:hypothetical protein